MPRKQAKTITFLPQNIGRKVKVQGEEVEIDFISANKQKFRKAHGEGEVVQEFTLDDIDEAESLVIQIK